MFSILGDNDGGDATTILAYFQIKKETAVYKASLRIRPVFVGVCPIIRKKRSPVGLQKEESIVTSAPYQVLRGMRALGSVAPNSRALPAPTPHQDCSCR